MRDPAPRAPPQERVALVAGESPLPLAPDRLPRVDRWRFEAPGAVGLRASVLHVAPSGVSERAWRWLFATHHGGARLVAVAFDAGSLSLSQERSLRARLVALDLDGDDVPVVALRDEPDGRERALSEALEQALLPSPWVDPADEPLVFPVEDRFNLRAGVVVTGVVVAGRIAVSTSVEQVGPQGVVPRAVLGLEMFRKLLPSAERGEYVGALLRAVEATDLGRGDVLATPGTLRAADTIAASVRWYPEPGPPRDLWLHAWGGATVRATVREEAAGRCVVDVAPKLVVRPGMSAVLLRALDPVGVLTDLAAR